ncbi:MAG TPA: hypothetical protein PLC98_13395 [Anaerolineales bacterium]|nr:hypothetical protein [Anaerolineales bacterium]
MPAFQSLNPLSLSGSLDLLQVFDSGPNPNTVIRRSEPWSVRLDWSISGGIAPALGGDWEVKVLLESMGGGFEGQIASTTVALATVAPAFNRAYTTTLNIAGGVVPTDGVYKLVVAILHRNLGVPTRMAGFEEGPFVEFYSAP